MTKVMRISVSSILSFLSSSNLMSPPHPSDGLLVMAAANGVLCLASLPNICRLLQRMIHLSRTERREAKVKLGRQKLVFVE